jgi:hypothetical protein
VPQTCKHFKNPFAKPNVRSEVLSSERPEEETPNQVYNVKGEEGVLLPKIMSNSIEINKIKGLFSPGGAS